MSERLIHPDEATPQPLAPGDIVVGDYFLKGGSVSTKGPGITIHLVKGPYKCLGQTASGLRFEMERIGDQNRYDLSLIKEGRNIGEYYGTFVVKSIKRHSIPELPKLSDQLECTEEVHGVLHRVRKTRRRVADVVHANDEHETKEIIDLQHLGNMKPGMKLSGKITRKNQKDRAKQDIDYVITRIDANRIKLTREVYNPRTREKRKKEYFLGAISNITSTDYVGTITSLDSQEEKGDFEFSIKPFQS